MSAVGQSRRFWDVRSKSVLHSTSDIMAGMKDQVSLGFTGARAQPQHKGFDENFVSAEQTPGIID